MGALEEIIRRLEVALGPLTRAPEPLEGGITNRNYRTGFAGRDYVIRLPGKDTDLLGINREAERLAARMAWTLGIAPPVAAAEPDCLVTAYLPCTPVGPGDLAAAPEPVARALRAFHDCGLVLPVRFWVTDLLDAYARTISARGGSLPDGYREMRDLAARIGRALPLLEAVPCHDDLLAGNVLRAQEGAFLLVDWEYAGMGHRMFDLGNLAVNHDLDEAAERRLLTAYYGEPVGEDRWAALRLMRIVSEARESAWGAIQAVVSELEFDFDAYASEHLARLEAEAADPRLEDWLDAAAA